MNTTLFQTAEFFNRKEGKWEVFYFADGERVTQEEYFRIMDSQNYYKDEEECYCCNDCDDEDVSIDELLDIYVDRIQESCGCKNCTRDILEDLVSEVLAGIED